MKLPTAESCAECGIGQRGHGQRWVMGAGLHGYVAPSKQQIAARIRRRMQYAGRLPFLSGDPASEHSPTS